MLVSHPKGGQARGHSVVSWKLILAGFPLLLLGASGCRYTSEVSELPVEPPLEELLLSRFGNTAELFATYSSGYDYSDQIPESLFDGFWGGITASEAETLFGPPVSVESEPYGQVYEYEVEAGHVALMEIPQPGGTWWNLRLYPKSLVLEDVLPP
ncbi:MAG TPA: hypothetical protein VMS76_17690, partial [Planctomycetota bacterium]|nr:hypothetical protein [Planctomycetota bacterium]